MPRMTGTTQPVRQAKAQVRQANFQASVTPRATAAQTSQSATLAATQSTSKPGCCCSACAGLECLDRTRFFAGQLLSEADLNNEQSYWLAKSRLHNRYLVGWGVACGLQV